MQKITLKISLIFIITFLFTACNNEIKELKNNKSIPHEIPFALVIHGGAGTIKKEFMTDEQEKAYKDKLQEALDTGYKILENGGTAIEAVQKTINIMEDSPLFNAGKGAVFNNLGKQEMDASIMDGKTLNAGAVAGVSLIRNPINAALLVKDSTRHIMLSGKGAEEFAKQYGLRFEDATYFHTDKRYNQLQKALEKEKIILDHTAINENNLIDDHKLGTVGCVAIDKDHNIAAGTSTGGMTNKKFGRIGDSPIIGAGTYANNLTCGVSATGTGEYFIRTLAAHEVSNLIQYKNISLKEALKQVIHIEIDSLGGDGGLIGLDKNGNIAWDFNTEGMYRGYKKSTGESLIEIYKK
ncbi:MAG: isoaspartyl peptidase/L-asparaginase [Bacteroidota bacterium]